MKPFKDDMKNAFYLILQKFFVSRFLNFQKQPVRGILRKRCSENMQQIYRRTPMPKCDFNKVEKANSFIQ